MKKFLIKFTPMIVGIFIAILISTLISILCLQNSNKPASLSHETCASTNETTFDSLETTSLMTESQSENETSSESSFSEEVVSSEVPYITEKNTENFDQDSTDQDTSKFDFIPMSQSLRSHVEEVSTFYGFDEELIYQIIYIESRFDPRARNGACVGLMQVNTKYSKAYLTLNDGLPFETQINENSDIYDPYVNIVVGIRILDDWRQMGSERGFYELNDWLCFYNMGWNYRKKGSNRYDKLVLETDLYSIDFSRYKTVE